MRSVGGGAADSPLRYPPPAGFAEGERGPGAAVAFPRPCVEPSRLVPCSISSTDTGRLWVPRSAFRGGGIPPDNSGPRVTSELSRRGARALQDACQKAVTVGHGFRAMWTFTLGPESRERLAGREFTLGAEVRRTVDLLQHWNDDHGKPRLLNEWVAENPEDDNPHVHMNTDYLSRQQDFRKYAAYVEDVWGHGWVTQERLREPRAAAAYLLKCVGYVSKGVQSGQGTIYGNRYGMSSCLRAVRLEPVEFFAEEAAATVFRLTSMPDGEAFRDLGRGVFATRHGIGTKVGSRVEVEQLQDFLAREGRWS